MIRKIFSLTLPLALIAVVSVATFSTSQSATQAPGEVLRTMPVAWVPFTADFVQMAPNYPAPDKGRFHRSSDGSERNEIFEGLTIGVFIKNIAERKFYRRAPEGHWNAHPMILPPEGWLPVVELRQGPNLVAAPEKFEGMDAYMLTSPKGDMVGLHVPDLNFFRVAGLFPGNKSVRFSNIKLGETDPGLFLPPPGAVIKHMSTPSGIVYSTER